MSRRSHWSLEELRRQLQCLAESRPGKRLPPVGELARRFGVATRRISAALAGARIGAPAPLPPPGPPRPPPLPSAETLYLRLREEIALGRYRSGHTLPKLEHLRLESRVSNRTAAEAYRRLEREGLAHREGRTWVVGKAPIPKGLGPSPALLLVQPDPVYWLKLKTQRTERFLFGFTAEAETNGVRMVPFTLNPTGPRGLQIAQALAASVRDLRSPYLGAMVVGDQSRYSDLPALIRALQALGRPVAWLDRTSTDLSSWGTDSRLFAPCRLSESAQIRTAIGYLHAHGHRCLGFSAHSYQAPPWQLERNRALAAEAEAWGMHMKDTQSQIKAFYAQSPEELAIRIREWRKAGGRSGKVVEYLTQNLPPAMDAKEHRAPSISRLAAYIHSWLSHTDTHPEPLRFLYETLPMLLDPEITALVFANDWSAQQIQPRIAAMGFRIPEDLTMLSFDNYMDFAHLPVNTVDPGVGLLGYQAFHFLFGAVPIKRTALGAIEPKPRVLDRGSAGPAKGIKVP